eukprot:TRINITY_DN18079_c0_g3_i5.p1 TRINITY_DN18079_c0_g3~~TRINITY_DN18079_c0_g3_i5.p1  ORF type:complete len:103 (-),score=7.19 TRINITY_DN18079_c0_g3_i5:97-405(-)
MRFQSLLQTFPLKENFLGASLIRGLPHFPIHCLRVLLCRAMEEETCISSFATLQHRCGMVGYLDPLEYKKRSQNWRFPGPSVAAPNATRHWISPLSAANPIA